MMTRATCGGKKSWLDTRYVIHAAETLNPFVKATCIKLSSCGFLRDSNFSSPAVKPKSDAHFVEDCRGDMQSWRSIKFALKETADLHSSHGPRLSLSERDPNRMFHSDTEVHVVAHGGKAPPINSEACLWDETAGAKRIDAIVNFGRGLNTRVLMVFDRETESRLKWGDRQQG